MTARYCGRCHACCVHLDVPDRAAHEPCRHLDQWGRCGIYDSRPEVCRGFSCAWLAGLIPIDYRPDQVGLIIQMVKNDLGGIGVNIVECQAGAADAQPELVKQLESWPCRLLRTDYLDGRQRMYSRDERWIEYLRTNNPELNIPTGAQGVELFGVRADRKGNQNA